MSRARQENLHLCSTIHKYGNLNSSMWGVGGAEYNSRILRSAIVFKRQTLLHPEESSGSEQ